MRNPLEAGSITVVGSLIFLCAAALLGARSRRAKQANVNSTPLVTLLKTPPHGTGDILPIHSTTPGPKRMHVAASASRKHRHPPLYRDPAATLGRGTRRGTPSPPPDRKLQESSIQPPPPAYTRYPTRRSGTSYTLVASIPTTSCLPQTSTDSGYCPVRSLFRS